MFGCHIFSYLFLTAFLFYKKYIYIIIQISITFIFNVYYLHFLTETYSNCESKKNKKINPTLARNKNRGEKMEMQLRNIYNQASKSNSSSAKWMLSNHWRHKLMLCKGVVWVLLFNLKSLLSNKVNETCSNYHACRC